MLPRPTYCAAATLLLLGCTEGVGSESENVTAQPIEGVDVRSMALEVDLEQRSAVATLKLESEAQLTLEAGDLEVASVTRGGAPLDFTRDGEALAIELPQAGAHELRIDYTFALGSEGLLATGSTLLWPYHCGSLFPCRSAPADGLTFSLSVSGAPTGESIVFPSLVDAEVPAYVVAWATGPYQHAPLGVTAAGTELSVWYLPGNEAEAMEGTTSLVEAFAYFEDRLGPYAFGSEAGSVEADWNGGAYGGMEHHPFWHVGSGSLADEETHVHEAAHGWFGDGIRIACWEDFVLSEGTVSYLTAHAIGAVSGEAREQEIWEGYETRLASATSSGALQIAWPEGCGEIDILEDRLFSSVPYMKGAFFFRALEHTIGAEALLDALSQFYQARVGKAAHMSDLLATLEDTSGYDPRACADSWLRSDSLPEVDACP